MFNRVALVEVEPSWPAPHGGRVNSNLDQTKFGQFRLSRTQVGPIWTN